MDPSDYIIHHKGSICFTPWDGYGDPLEEDRIKVGLIDGFVIDATRAINDGVSIVDACDAIDQETYDYAATIFDLNNDFRKSVEKALGEEAICANASVLVINRMAIAPEHRGQRLGLRCARRFIDMFGLGCGLIALKPHPLQSNRLDPEEREEASLCAHPATNRTQARKRLTKYWGELGFIPLGRTGYCILSTEFRIPSIKELGGGRLIEGPNSDSNLN